MTTMPVANADLLLLLALTASWPFAARWAWRERAAALAALESAGFDHEAGLRQRAQEASAADCAAGGSGSSGSAGSQTSTRVPWPGVLTMRRPPPSPSAR